MDKRKNIAVIGAGLGGLAAAIRLAAAGYKVDVYEKNSQPGGKANQIFNNGFRFDTGPSLLTMPFVIEELFNDVDERIEDYLELIKLDIACKYFYPDETILSAYSDLNKFAGEFENRTRDKADSIIRFFSYSKNIYNLTADLFLFKSFSELKTFINLKSLKTLLSFRKIDAFRTMHEAISSFFIDNRTIQFFDRYATYNGSNPYLAPATLNIIPHVEHNPGAFLPIGGIYKLTKALYKLTLKKGAQIFFNHDVKKILVEGNRVKGIAFATNENITNKKYDVIISNADVNSTYKYLLGADSTKQAKKYNLLEPSSSALVFYWGVKGQFDLLETHNVLFSADYKKEFDELFVEKKCPDDPTIYIYISAKKNKNDAPDGFENWYVMINAPYNSGQDWEKGTVRMRDKVINKINRLIGVNLSDKIVFENILTPVDIEKNTGSFRGSLYGVSSNSRYSAFRRQQNRSKDFRGLYFCGGSAHPGGGIPLVILSGKITAELITKYEHM
ncbi:MAG: phytoene desaturase family protein [bacterium]